MTTHELIHPNFEEEFLIRCPSAHHEKGKQMWVSAKSITHAIGLMMVDGFSQKSEDFDFLLNIQNLDIQELPQHIYKLALYEEFFARAEMILLNITTLQKMLAFAFAERARQNSKVFDVLHDEDFENIVPKASDVFGDRQNIDVIDFLPAINSLKNVLKHIRQTR